MRPARDRWCRRAAALAALLLGACGIDQGGIDNGQQLPQAQLTVISGPIEGFGSVHVNGLVLDARNAQILIDGSPGAESDLRAGQVIRAVAMVERGTSRALSIEYQRNLVGPVDALDKAADALTVLGQRVLTNSATRLDVSPASTLDDLTSTEPIIVSGLRTPAGDILATYIGRAAPADALRITAPITALDSAGLTFDLAGLKVDYSQVLVLEAPSGMPELGAVVEVIGSVLSGGTLRAEQVRALPLQPGLFNTADTALTSTETPLVGAAAPSGAALAANFVGFITANHLPDAISLFDLDVAIGPGTVVIGGAAGDLTVGKQVRVEGRIAAFGRIEAERIAIL